MHRCGYGPLNIFCYSLCPLRSDLTQHSSAVGVLCLVGVHCNASRGCALFIAYAIGDGD
jgi:hypothetical protein